MQRAARRRRKMPCGVPSEAFLRARFAICRSFAIASRLAPGSLLFSRFVLARIGRANEGVRPGLDGIGKLLQILTNVPQVFEQFVDIVGVDVERLIKPSG